MIKLGAPVVVICVCLVIVLIGTLRPTSRAFLSAIPNPGLTSFARR